MSNNYFKNGFNESENRFLFFGKYDRFRSGDMAERMRTAREKVEAEAAIRAERGRDLSDGIDTTRIDEPDVDPQYNAAHNRASLTRFEAGAGPVNPRLQGARERAYELKTIFGHTAELSGLEFGDDGGTLRVIGADPKFIKFGINYALQSISGLRRNAQPSSIVTRREGESARDYNLRKQETDQAHATARLNSYSVNAEAIAQWEIVITALRRADTEYASMRQVVKAVDANPQSVNTISKEYREANPATYKKLVVKAAMRDASVLRGKEEQFGTEEFITIVTEAAKSSPAALVYFPESQRSAPDTIITVDVTDPSTGIVSKEVRSGNQYRVSMIEAAKKDGRVLQQAAREYDQHWADKANSTYKQLAVAAINTTPSVVFTDWKRGNGVEAFREVVTKLDDKTKLQIISIMPASSTDALSDYDNGGYIGLINDMFSSDPDGTLIALAKNKDVFNKMKVEDDLLYQAMVSRAVKSDNDNIKKLFQLDHVSEDEDLAEARLGEVFLKLFEENPSAGDFEFKGKKYSAKPGWQLVFRDNQEMLKNVPDHVWKTPKYQEFIMQFFFLKGENFQYAPESFKNDKEIVLLVVGKNASAFAFASPELRNDAEILYVALLAENDKESGNFFYKHAGPDLQKKCGGGIPDTDVLLKKIILGQDDFEDTDPDTVHSLMDLWKDDMKKDPKLVTAYLQRNADRPQFFVDVDPSLRGDIDFVQKVLAKNPRLFTYIGEENHIKFKDDPKYISMLGKAYEVDRSTIDAVPKQLLSSADFVLKAIYETGTTAIIQSVPDEIRSQHDFIVTIYAELLSRGESKRVLASIIGNIPDDPGLLQKLMLLENGKLLSLMLEDPALLKSVPKSAISVSILSTLISRANDSGANSSRIMSLLQMAESSVAKKYLELNPQLAIELFKDSPQNITILGDELITVSLLRDIVGGYNDYNINRLFVLLMPVKPNALVGLLRNNFELWNSLQESTQQELTEHLDEATLINLIDQQESLQQSVESKEKSRYLAQVKVLRQEVDYYIALAGGIDKFPTLDWYKNKQCNSAQKIKTWADKEFAKVVETGTYTKAETDKVVAIYKEFTKQLKSHIDITTVDPTKLSTIDLDPTKDAGTPPVNKEHEIPLAYQELKLLSDFVVEHSDDKKTDTQRTPDQKDKAKEVLSAARKELILQISARIEEVQSLPASEDKVQKIADILSVFTYDVINSETQPLKKALLTRKRKKLQELQVQTKQDVIREKRAAQSSAPAESYYDLPNSQLEFVDTASKYLGIDKEQFAKVLSAMSLRDSGLVSRAYLELADSPSDWSRAKDIASALDESFSPFTADKLTVLVDCISLAKERHAARIIRDLVNPTTPLPADFTTGFEGQPITKLNLKNDLSMIKIVSRKLGGSYDRARMLQTWKEIRKDQWESFQSGADVNETLKQKKPTDMHVILENDGNRAIMTNYKPKLKAMLAAMNKGTGESVEPIIHIVNNKQEVNVAMNTIITAQNDAGGEYQNGNRHLALYVLSHGAGESGNALQTDLNTISAKLDPDTTTLMYTSCSGGTHMSSVARSNPNSIEANVFTTTDQVAAPLSSSEMLPDMIQRAYEAPEADINGDGVTSITEVWHWIDTNLKYQDAVGYGPGGIPLVNNTSNDGLDSVV